MNYIYKTKPTISHEKNPKLLPCNPKRICFAKSRWITGAFDPPIGRAVDRWIAFCFRVISITKSFDPSDHRCMTMTVTSLTVRIVFDVECAWQRHSVRWPTAAMSNEIFSLYFATVKIRSSEVIRTTDDADFVWSFVLLTEIRILVAGTFGGFYVSKRNAICFCMGPIDISL